MRDAIEDAWSRLVQILSVDDDSVPNVDTDYLLSERVQYEWITVKHDETVRCDICGRLMALEQMPDLIEHVATHDEQGAAEIDPTETPADVYDVEVYELENNDETEPAKI